jgi:beta-galactosidase
MLPQHWTAGEATGDMGGGAGRGDRVFLTFEGVDAAMTVYVNGAQVGYSQDSRLPAEFDVTDALVLESGCEQLLAVKVMRWCDGSYLEDQDMWWLSGIYREVRCKINVLPP